MFKCKCGKKFEKSTSLNSHARFCELYNKKKKITTDDFYENGFFKCKCGKQFEKKTSLITHFGHCYKYNKKRKNYENLKGNIKTPWNKGLNKHNNVFIKNGGETLSNKIKNGERIPGFKNKKHTKETKEKISASRSENNNGYIKCKYYEIFSPFMNKNVNVQGTWERDFAYFLNEKKINWIRDKKKSLKYKHHKDDYTHNYYPDFYLPDFDMYVEIKGFWFKSSDGKVDDKRKMKKVINQNKNLKIVIFEKHNAWIKYFE